MNRRDQGVGVGLICLALFIWVRDLSWIQEWADTLPILVALPLFFWLGSPFTPTQTLRWQQITAAILCILAGIATDLTLLLTAGWCLLLYFWLTPPLALMTLPFLAFPWITLDAEWLGWWFRYSGAGATAALLHLFGYEATWEGTQIVVKGLPISVEAACSGLNTLQALLIAGVAMAYLYFGSSRAFFWNILLLPLVAWGANTLRIIVLTFAAILVNPQFAQSAFHTWGGLLVLLVMFGITWMFFSWQQTRGRRP